MPVPALAARPWQITNANVEPCGGISPCKTPSGNRQPVIRRIMRVSFNQPRRIEFLTQVRESVGLMGRISRRNKTEFEINSVSSAQGVIVVGLYEIFASENSEIQRTLILSTILPFDCCVDVLVGKLPLSKFLHSTYEFTIERNFRVFIAEETTADPRCIGFEMHRSHPIGKKFQRPRGEESVWSGARRWKFEPRGGRRQFAQGTLNGYLITRQRSKCYRLAH